MAAPMRQDSDRKNERIGLRASESQRSLLAAASQSEGTTLSDFVLRHATRAAENILADRRVFVLPDESWREFDALLSRAEQDVPGLKTLVTERTVLDR